jgi:ribosomal protein L11 methyltransferase
MSSPDRLHVLSISIEPVLDSTLEATFELLGIASSRWASSDGKELRYDVFFDAASDATELEHALGEQLKNFSDTESWSIEVKSIPNENWKESWKVYFHVERVSPRIVIKPTWEPYTPLPEDCVIEIDPGMSFGTGQHATTKGCLQFLDSLASPGMSFLDLGCGSGILSIAAAKLGYTPITALDIDPDSVRIAKENLSDNHVDPCVEVMVADVSTWEAPQQYAVVVANILAPVLLANAERIATAVVPQTGILILAGILTEQYASICERYEALGFKEIKQITEAEWTSGYFQAP